MIAVVLATAAAAARSADTVTAASQKVGAPTTQPWLQAVQLPDHWPGQLDVLQWSARMSPGVSTTLILMGIVYLLFGFYLFKGLLVVNSAFAGAWIGAVIGARTGSVIPGAVIGAFIAAAVTIPLMKWAVSILGGLLGAGLGGGIWRMVDLDPRFAWAGAGMGLIAGGMFCFILFRGSIMAYMSLQGALMLVFGLLGLLYKYQDLGPKLTRSLQDRNFILPMAIFIPAVIGLLYQQANNKPMPAGPPKK